MYTFRFFLKKFLGLFHIETCMKVRNVSDKDIIKASHLNCQLILLCRIERPILLVSDVEKTDINERS